jgi:hypothetical protein
MTTVSKDDLAAVAAELAAARREVMIALTVASLFADDRAREGDAQAATIAPLIRMAYDRLVVSNVAATTAVAEAQQQER